MASGVWIQMDDEEWRELSTEEWGEAWERMCREHVFDGFGVAMVDVEVHSRWATEYVERVELKEMLDGFDPFAEATDES